MRQFRFLILCTCCAIGAGPANAQRAIPVRTLTAAVGTDSGVLLDVDNIRPLANGRVMVNDRFRHRLMLFEQTLQRFTTIADSAAGARVSYPVNAGAIIMPFLGDSTAWLDAPSNAFVIINPSGLIVRTMALPNANDRNDRIALMSGNRGSQGFDSQGRLVHTTFRASPPHAAPPENECNKVYVYWAHDSAVIVRRDPATRLTDTVGLVARAANKRWVACPSSTPGALSRSAPTPIPVVDDWTLLPDGTVAIVRAHDYHIDWIDAKGRMTSTPKMPFDWLRITPEQKVHFADSVNAAIAARGATPQPASTFAPELRRPDMSMFPPVTFEADSLPDYYPPIRDFTVKSDPDGNVWVLPTTSVLADGGLIYDVINRKGEIVERVKLPPGRRLIAVGYRGVVYLAYTPKGLVRLERATVIRN